MSITIHDLARLAGVNPSTISRALRNDPRVRESTRERICALAKRHGYTPNLNARNLADGKTRMIAFLMGSLEYQLEREAAVALNELLSQYGYTLMILSYAPDAERLYPDRLEKLTQKICDGAILIAPTYQRQEPLLPILQAVRMPLVCIDRRFRDFQLPLVTTDNTLAMRQLFEHALGAGMDGAVIHFRTTDSVCENRREELVKILQNTPVPFCLAENEAAVADFIKRNHIRKAAVFSNNCTDISDFISVLPENFIVGAFDRSSGFLPPRAGTVFLCIQDYCGIARTAGEILLEQLKNPQSEPRSQLIPPLEILCENRRD
ncbi:MAG: LacI family DNA-binding transcriptional regulator [Lentisphaeria bacterium]|nr:LacI family DNA-binding transcriptional regulator [Lentisphaeria bacterium]